MNEPCDLSLRQAGALLRRRELSSVEFTESTLKRIEQTEPAIHAYVRVMADEALDAARQADAELRDGTDRGPLHGMPIAIKDIFDVRGVPTKCGSRVREQANPAADDATSVARLRAAGAVILGKTTTQEFAAGVVSPPARNPWDTTRIPGGSSGGSAAAVAAGSALAAFGSDTGGSIRNPAALCGVVGLKPTFGTVSTRGVFPLAWSLDTVGPLARTVEDAALVLNAIADSPARDTTAEIGEGLRGLRLGVPRPHFYDRLQAGVREAVEAALAVFADLGAEVIEAPWAEAAAARATCFLINRVETVGVHGAGVRATPELYGEELSLRVQANALYSAEGYVRALRARSAIKASVARLFATHRLDALIAPSAPGTAVPADDLYVVDDEGNREHVSLAYTRLTMPFNATGQPVLAIPCGFDPAGLPIGLQIAGRPFAEARLCRIGAAYESAEGRVQRADGR
ncbi:MAG: aspartyl-tRNA(Asn)/glutamyl-tRNA(Gln) amidotransferase subunit [Thermomicrobiales bacterium]|nr:aspartyl-tRNA(Asn)/glutamyl-tRNA(Gln) amidotransferase subunit [Thermomicrobiales bacterium]